MTGRPRTGVSSTALAVLAALSSIAILALGGRGRTAWFLLAVAAGTVTSVAIARRGDLSMRAASVTCFALIAVAIAMPPRSSRDLWAYAMYGRIVSAHHASPYVHAPAEYANDAYLARMHPAFRDTRSVYGPVFTAVSAAGTAVAGRHPLLARLWFQLLSGLSALGALAIVARRTRSGAAVGALGLHPLIAASVVNGGHNDSLVGLGVLAGAVLSTAHPILAGAILGLAAGVKIVAVVPAAALAIWRARAGARRDAVTLALTTAAVVGAGYALAGGGAALRPLRDAANLVNVRSFWRFAFQHVHAAHTVATVIVLAAAIAIAFSRRMRSPVEVAGAGTLPYLLGAPYVLPWYSAWSMPSLAIEPRSPLFALAAVQAAVVMMLYPYRDATGTGLFDVAQRFVARTVAPAAGAIAFVGLLVWATRRGVRRAREARDRAPVSEASE